MLLQGDATIDSDAYMTPTSAITQVFGVFRACRVPKLTGTPRGGRGERGRGPYFLK